MAGKVTGEELAPIAALSTAAPALAVEDGELVLTEVGIAGDGPAGWTLSEERWEKAGRAIAGAGERARLAVNFAIGDWYNAGAAKWGSRARSLASALPGYSYNAVRHFGYVADRFAYHTRLAGFSWSIYEALAPEPEEVRLRWLTEAANGTLAPNRQWPLLREMQRARLAAQRDANRTAPKQSVADGMESKQVQAPLDALATSSLSMGSNSDNLTEFRQIVVEEEQCNTVSSPEEVIASADPATVRRLLLERVLDWPDTARQEMALAILRGLPRGRREDVAYQLLGTHQITSYLGWARWEKVHDAAQRLRVSDYTLLGLLIDRADQLLCDEAVLEPGLAGTRR